MDWYVTLQNVLFHVDFQYSVTLCLCVSSGHGGWQFGGGRCTDGIWRWWERPSAGGSGAAVCSVHEVVYGRHVQHRHGVRLSSDADGWASHTHVLTLSVCSFLPELACRSWPIIVSLQCMSPQRKHVLLEETSKWVDHLTCCCWNFYVGVMQYVLGLHDLEKKNLIEFFLDNNCDCNLKCHFKKKIPSLLFLFVRPFWPNFLWYIYINMAYYVKIIIIIIIVIIISPDPNCN